MRWIRSGVDNDYKYVFEPGSNECNYVTEKCKVKLNSYVTPAESARDMRAPIQTDGQWNV